MESLRLVLVKDASFENARGMKSLLGLVFIMVDKTGNENIVHYGSIRCRRVIRSVMESETQGLVLGFDFSYGIRDMLVEIIGKEMVLEAFVEISAVFDFLAKYGKKTERRLQICI